MGRGLMAAGGRGLIHVAALRRVNMSRARARARGPGMGDRNAGLRTAPESASFDRPTSDLIAMAAALVPAARGDAGSATGN